MFHAKTFLQRRYRKFHAIPRHSWQSCWNSTILAWNHVHQQAWYNSWSQETTSGSILGGLVYSNILLCTFNAKIQMLLAQDSQSWSDLLVCCSNSHNDQRLDWFLPTSRVRTQMTHVAAKLPLLLLRDLPYQAKVDCLQGSPKIVCGCLWLVWSKLLIGSLWCR